MEFAANRPIGGGLVTLERASHRLKARCVAVAEDASRYPSVKRLLQS